jgi:hypothetical protein
LDQRGVKRWEVGENYIMRSFITWPSKIKNDKVKEDEIGRVCSTHDRKREYIHGFGGEARWKDTTRKA